MTFDERPMRDQHTRTHLSIRQHSGVDEVQVHAKGGSLVVVPDSVCQGSLLSSPPRKSLQHSEVPNDNVCGASSLCPTRQVVRTAEPVRNGWMLRDGRNSPALRHPATLEVGVEVVVDDLAELYGRVERHERVEGAELDSDVRVTFYAAIKERTVSHEQYLCGSLSAGARKSETSLVQRVKVRVCRAREDTLGLPRGIVGRKERPVQACGGT
jgi:hypothetical protein